MRSLDNIITDFTTDTCR